VRGIARVWSEMRWTRRLEDVDVEGREEIRSLK
jgi:hypothetical protein